MYADHWFDSEKATEFVDVNIDELLDIQRNQFPSIVKRWTHERTDFTIVHSILLYQLVISKTPPYEGSSYSPFLKEPTNPMKRLINIQNQGNDFFRC